MLLRIKLYQRLFKIAAYLLPFFSFHIGLRTWSFTWSMIGRPTDFVPKGHFAVLLLSCFVWGFFAEHYKVTSVDELFGERTGARGVLSACLATFVVLLAIMYFMHTADFPRGLFLYNMLALLVLGLVVRTAFRILCRSRFDSTRPTKLVIIGSDRFARDAALRLQLLSFAPCQVAGFVHLPGQELEVANSRIYELEELSALSAADGIDEAVIALRPERFPLIPEIIRVLDKLCLPARAIVDLGEGTVVRERLFQLGRMQMLDLTTTPADLVDYALLKRAFDISFSATVLFLSSPILLLVALLIRITSPGPALFTQERVGLNGRPFAMYKFRTMCIAAGSESDTQWTKKGDPRCTAIGRVLRKSSLDELPQFINVLKGDMSVVGPRPERPHFVHKFLEEVGHYNKRHCLKVGITGWAQVNGWRGDTSIQKRVEYDLYYLQNWSFILDLRIIAMTVLSGLINKNAY